MRKLIGILLLFALPMNQHAQDPVLSQFYANALSTNPALAGIEGLSRIYIGYRNQWPNAGKSFITYQSTYDQYIEKLHGGIGVSVLNDRQAGGVFNTYNLDLMYAYQFRATRRWSFAGAIQAGIGQRSFNPVSLVFGDMWDPESRGLSNSTLENVHEDNDHYPDFATGITWFNGRFYGGIAIHHLLSPVIANESEEPGRLPRKYTAHIGALIPIVENRRGKEIMKLSPNLVFIQQKYIQQINYGVDAYIRDLVLGVWTRHDYRFNYGNLIFTAGYSAGNIRFRYSYDIKLISPTVNIVNMGAHEISLLITYENERTRNERRAIKCPNF